MKAKNTVLVLSLALAATITACGGAAASPPPEAPMAAMTPAANAVAPVSTAVAAMKAPGDAKIGDKTMCPVSKEEFTVTESSPKAELNGKTYYFCCPGCAGKFKADAPKFLGASKT